jgi:hypothetical protein
MGVLKYYQLNTAIGAKQNREQAKEEAFLNLQQEKAGTGLYFPIALLQPPLRLR